MIVLVRLKFPLVQIVYPGLPGCCLILYTATYCFSGQNEAAPNCCRAISRSSSGGWVSKSRESFSQKLRVIISARASLPSTSPWDVDTISRGLYLRWFHAKSWISLSRPGTSANQLTMSRPFLLKSCFRLPALQRVQVPPRLTYEGFRTRACGPPSLPVHTVGYSMIESCSAHNTVACIQGQGGSRTSSTSRYQHGRAGFFLRCRRLAQPQPRGLLLQVRRGDRAAWRPC